MVKIDLGCGEWKKEGFIGIDNSDTNVVNQHKFKPDIVHDLRTGIPFKDDEVEEVYCSHFLEHINPYALLDEIWRVCKPDSIVTIYVPLHDIRWMIHITYFYDPDMKRDMENIDKYKVIKERRDWFSRNLNFDKFEIIKKEGRTKRISDKINEVRYLDEIKIVLKVKKKIKLYGFYTDVHKVLKDNFLKTLQDDWDINITHLDIGGNGNFRSKEFLKVLDLKIRTCLAAIKENRGNIIIWSDMDIQFFGKCDELIKKEIENKDILFIQQGDSVNTGFEVIRCNERTEELFMLASKEDTYKHHLVDNGVINDLLKRKVVKDLVYGKLPSCFWETTHSELPPKDIILHHAVDTAATEDKTSLQLKLEQLDKIGRYVNGEY